MSFWLFAPSSQTFLSLGVAFKVTVYVAGVDAADSPSLASSDIVTTLALFSVVAFLTTEPSTYVTF